MLLGPKVLVCKLKVSMSTIVWVSDAIFGFNGIIMRTKGIEQKYLRTRFPLSKMWLAPLSAIGRKRCGGIFCNVSKNCVQTLMFKHVP